MDVPGEFLKIGIRINEYRLVTALKKMA